jgi:uncharacterized protein (DUF1501 family)
MSADTFNRRRFLGTLLAGAGSAAAPLALNLAAIGNAAAQSGDGYKALVCLYMTGGNDHFNTVLPTDRDSWNEYQRLRSSDDNGSIALPGLGQTGGVLPIGLATPVAGRSFAVHPQLAAMKNLFEAGRAAVVANVGTLIQPTTLAQYQANSVPLPPKIGSHNDQQAIWQSCQPEGGNNGWGGRMADLLYSGNRNATFTCISTSGNAVFLSGRQVRQYQAAAGGAIAINNLGGTLFRTSGANNVLNSVITGSRANMFEEEHAAVVRRSIASQAVLTTAMTPVGPAGVPDPSLYRDPTTGAMKVNPLAQQLQTVARIIGGRSALGNTRQVFFVNMNGFDTHDKQKVRHADLMARLAHACDYFDRIMAFMAVRDQVTLFTASDFGRTLSSNGDGTDHGWGGHHFVIGGAVKGRNLYGSVPPLALGHNLDIGGGALLPTIGVDQYGATLAKWFGLSATQLTDVFPNLANFSQRDLGFMAT